MGYITPFNILLIALLSMQFATSNGTLICFVAKYAPCIQTFGVGVALGECKGDETVQCLKKTADDCDIKSSTDANVTERVLAFEQVFADMCEAGSDMNKDFLKYKGCVFGTELTGSNAKCYEKLVEAVLKYKNTGNTEKDTKAVVKISCEYSDDVNKCVNANVKEICGADALSFQRKLSEPGIKLEEMVCNSSPAVFGPFWTILLQAAVILMSLQYFGLKE